MLNRIPLNKAIFPISVVKQMTSLSGRQIRYYEEHGLLHTKRNPSNQRVFSLNDIERLLEIKLLIEGGVNVAGVKAIFSTKVQSPSDPSHDEAAYPLSEKEWEEALAFVQKKVDSFKRKDSSNEGT